MTWSGTGTPVTTTTSVGPALSTSGGCYARPVDLKAYLGITDTDDDALMLSLCERARAKIDEYCNRHFLPRVATRYYDANGLGDTLMLGHDLASVTTFTNGDGDVFTSAQYHLYPVSGPPYSWIELDSSRGILFEYSTTPQRAISIVGLWGWAETLLSTGTTAAAIATTTTTTVTPSSMADFEVGDMLKVESEYMYVRVNGASTLTVVRGFNGSTAATHSASTAIYWVRPPDGIHRIATRLTAWYMRQKDAPFETSGYPATGLVSVPAELPLDIKGDLHPWVRW